VTKGRVKAAKLAAQNEEERPKTDLNHVCPQEEENKQLQDEGNIPEGTLGMASPDYRFHKTDASRCRCALNYRRKGK
jgi:hypothetical protein